MIANRIILASASPQRSALLRRLGFEFDVMPCDLPEPSFRPQGVVASAWAMSLAYFKARWVAQICPGQWVLGADTVVWCHGELLGKPTSLQDARRMLQLQMGRESGVVTGMALVCMDSHQSNSRETLTAFRRWIGHDVTRVYIRHDAEFLEEYLAGGEWSGKAGAYGIQSTGERFVDRIDGSFDNVVGLPTELLTRILPVTFIATRSPTH